MVDMHPLPASHPCSDSALNSVMHGNKICKLGHQSISPFTQYLMEIITPFYPTTCIINVVREVHNRMTRVLYKQPNRG